MVSLDDVARLALSLPGVVEVQRHDRRAWAVAEKVFAWERAFSKADLKRFGDQAPPDGVIVAVGVEDLGEKEAVLGAGHPGVFTIAHFDGYPAVLVQLSAVRMPALRELIEDGWLAKAPPAVAREYVRPRRRRAAGS